MELVENLVGDVVVFFEKEDWKRGKMGKVDLLECLRGGWVGIWMRIY